MTQPRPILSVLPILAALFVALIAAAGASAAPQTYTNQQLGVTLSLPEGYAPDPTLAKAQPDFLCAYRKPASDAEGSDTLVILERMHGTIGREGFDRSRIKGQILPFKWDEFTLEGIELPETAGDVEILNYNVQVPLKPEAVQLRVAGEKGHAAELKALTTTLLGNLKGQSNWKRSAAPAGLASSPNYGATILVAVIIFVLGGLATLWMLRRRLPRGGVLTVAAVIWLVSYAIPAEVREALAFRGGVRLLGFLGMVLGLILLARRPKPVAATTPGGTPRPPPRL